MADDEIISQAEAARLLGLSRARVAAMLDAGVLPATERLVAERAVRRADVDALKARTRHPGRPRGKPRSQPGERGLEHER